MFVSILQYAALLLLAADLVACRQHRKNDEFEIYDVLIVARCEANCWNTTKNIHPCVKNCLQKGFLKPGVCESAEVLQGSTLSPFDSPCLDTCKNDLQCPDITKCCQHNCGISCQHPHGIGNSPGLPEIPTELTVKGKRRRSLYIQWNPSKDILGNTILYVIQERHHNGKYFMEKRMGDWTACYKSTKVGTVLKRLVKPGRWYQFRIAAINSNGTKGYSDNYAYSPTAGPRRPKAPQGLVVGPLWKENGTLHTNLRWKAPQSDLPIQKYKVFWSRRLHGVTALDSVLVLQQTVMKEHTSFIINNLEPDSLYFLQVQALTQYGKEILKSEKANILLNTTNYTNGTDLVPQNTSLAMNIEDLKLHRFFWSHGDLRARVSWKPILNSVKYIVSWYSGSCTHNDSGISYVKLAASTKASHFDIYDLQFGCKCRVSIRAVATNEEHIMMPEKNITFSIPSCKQFQSIITKLKCNKKLYY